MKSEYQFDEQRAASSEAAYLSAEKEYNEYILLQQIIEEENKAVLFTTRLGTPIKVSPYFYKQPFIYERKQHLSNSTGSPTTQSDTLLSPAFGRKG